MSYNQHFLTLIDAGVMKNWRILLNFRKFNENTSDDRYSSPNITDILDKLRSQYCSTLDLGNTFHQIVNAHEGDPKTAFIVVNGYYENVRVLCGLKNSPEKTRYVIGNVSEDMSYDSRTLNDSEKTTVLSRKSY